ncbi:MAG: YkgJ family cysteine cluster protein [Rhodocyclaceae bacterium]|nr:MAG: YkgJ family cysteine cluster protein [Rhodocyclaceae bacterium]
MTCRSDCAACCIAPSITSLGKPAGKACLHLDEDLCCRLFGLPERPACCAGLRPAEDMCGTSRDAAIAWLEALETATAPAIRP